MSLAHNLIGYDDAIESGNAGKLFSVETKFESVQRSLSDHGNGTWSLRPAQRFAIKWIVLGLN